jgi:hypothetical protein
MNEADPRDRHHLEAVSPLPPELAAFLRTQTRACLLLGTDRGSSFILKTPASDLDGLRGPLPILLRHELYRHWSSPVIRLLLRFYDVPLDQPPSSLAFESFINVDDEEQRSDYGELARQALIPLHFYDQALQHRLAKTVRNSLRPSIPQLLVTALSLRARIPQDQLDFDQAKAEVIARTSL